MGRNFTPIILLIFTFSFLPVTTTGLHDPGTPADNVFFTTVVQNYMKCLGLCTAISTCKTVNYHFESGSCELAKNTSRTTPTNNALYKAFSKLSTQIPKEISELLPCHPEDFCIMAAYGNGFISLNYKRAFPCDDPDTYPNMSVDKVRYTITGAEAMYICAERYTHSEGTGNSRCSQTNWTRPSLRCQSVDRGASNDTGQIEPVLSTTTTHQSTQSSPAADCSIPPVIPLMTLTFTGTGFGSTATYTCEAGYDGSGSGASTCQADGLWSRPALSCRVVDCGPPVDVRQIVPALFTTTTYQSEATFACGLGQEPSSGNNKATCLADGTWSIPTLQCTEMSDVVWEDISGGNTTSFLCENRQSEPSDVEDDAETSVQCEGSEILTGCTSYQTKVEPHLDGEIVREVGGNAICIAVNSFYATGCTYPWMTQLRSGSRFTKRSQCYEVPVKASARCCSMMGLKCEYLKMPVSVVDGNSQTTRTCKAGYWPTGCTTHHRFGKVYGVNLTAEGCVANNRDTNTGITICCTAPNMNCTNVESAETGPNKAASASVSCPSGYTMLGCMGYSPAGDILGSKTKLDNLGEVKCVVSNGKRRLDGEPRPRAFASCCKSDWFRV